MTDRIYKLVELSDQGEMYPPISAPQYDRTDLFLSPVEMDAKRTCEFILNQEPVLNEYSKFTGFLRFNTGDRVCGISGTLKNHEGRKAACQLFNNYYNKPLDNLTTFEAQHAVGDFERVINEGFEGLIKAIDDSLVKNTEPEKQEFLKAIRKICCTMIKWAEKCSDRAEELAEKTENAEHKENLIKLSNALKNVPAKSAKSFYEAVLSLYVTYSLSPDSIGLVDRYLYKFYKNDIESGALTRDEAKEYLQELFLMLQNIEEPDCIYRTRGGQSHFAIGGYLADGSDGFTDLSKLVIEALMELPTCIPEISLRWTKKTPREVLRFAMDCERKDPNKRIAFVNDEPRIKGLMEVANFPYEEAVKYSMTGCNEPTIPGMVFRGGASSNVARCIENVFLSKSVEIIKTEDFEAFYSIFEEELFADLEKILGFENAFNSVRARDCDILSSIVFEGCIEKGVSASKGDKLRSTSGLTLIGITTVIDCLTVVKQFVFDEKAFSMQELCNALKTDWNGYEEMHTLIKKKAKYFGNDDELSNNIAKRFLNSVYNWSKDKTDYMGNHLIMGNLVGYNQHQVWFGKNMTATPDGRKAGDPISFGIGQSDSRDRNGVGALLNSVAACDEHGILTGNSVTNVLIDEKLIMEDDYFDKTVDMFETYLKNGGLHFQLTYVSKEDMLNAKKDPEKYRSLRVRVTGFSDYFTRLNEDWQDDIIERTTHSK